MSKQEMSKKEQIQYLYPYRRFKIMVGHITKGRPHDWYYLNCLETTKYLLTGHLPHEGMSGRWVRKWNRGKNRPPKR